ncbi:MAG: UDP-N-acetylglucosamine 2-epimerase (non-hydrolyzing) [Planctomycetota bacterium]
MALRVAIVAGARPNFVKVAPIVRAMRTQASLAPILVHTGQHYDYGMSKVFFEDLDLPEPDVHLGVGSGTHAEQTSRVMTEFDRALDARPADVVVVVGDVNSTMAAALVAVKRRIPVVHVEAGLRSYDRGMPEEVNRVVTDSVADLLLTPSRDADANLAKEGIDPARIVFVGNVMIDSLAAALPAARARGHVARLGLSPGRFALVTLHRPTNVDEEAPLRRVLSCLDEVALACPVVFPVHPRTSLRLETLGRRRTSWADARAGATGLLLVPPVGYLDFMELQAASGAVVTDSGGIQEETTWLGVPCLTLRPNTERPITVTEGTNEVIGDRLDLVPGLVAKALRGEWKKGRIPDLWDGRTAGRIIAALQRRYSPPAS